MIFGIFFTTLSIVVWIKMPKNMTKAEMFFCSTFAITFQQTVDMFVDAKLDLYGYFSKGVDWLYIPLVMPLFMALINISLNFYPFNRSFKDKFLYTLCLIILSTLFEWIALHTKFFYYNGWKIWWSAIMYPFLFNINAFALSLFRKWNIESKKGE